MQLREPAVSLCETVQQLLLQLANLAATKITFILSCFSKPCMSLFGCMCSSRIMFGSYVREQTT